MNPTLGSGRLATAIDEDLLVARAQAGDGEAFEVLADRYSTRLRRVLYRITHDPDAAYDATQEALLRAWKNIDRFEGRSRFYTWLTRIGINEARRTRAAPTVSLELEQDIVERVPDDGNGPDEVLESREFLQAVEAALLELRPHYRTAVTLRDVEGLSTSEAAQVLGIGERTLKSRLHRGRMALRAKLHHYLDEGYA